LVFESVGCKAAVCGRSVASITPDLSISEGV
jgi:hypothetical protein